MSANPFQGIAPRFLPFGPGGQGWAPQRPPQPAPAQNSFMPSYLPSGTAGGFFGNTPPPTASAGFGMPTYEMTWDEIQNMPRPTEENMGFVRHTPNNDPVAQQQALETFYGRMRDPANTANQNIQTYPGTGQQVDTGRYTIADMDPGTFRNLLESAKPVDNTEILQQLLERLNDRREARTTRRDNSRELSRGRTEAPRTRSTTGTSGGTNRRRMNHIW